jgi:pimeloyl-ACP methyl ester carboxylesterase
MLADSLIVHDSVAKRFPGRAIVAVGFSVGTGVAAHLAARRPIAGAILVTPFDSLTSVAAGHYPWLPVRLLFRHPMELAREIAGCSVPVAIVAGGADTVIPRARTDALRRAVSNLVFDRTVPGAGHNDIYRHSAFQSAMREALAQVRATR